MGLFEQFPYTNFHELNLDWLLQEMKRLAGRMDTVEEVVEELKREMEEFFDDLNLQREVNAKIDEMAQDGSLLDVIRPYLRNYTEDLDYRIDAFMDDVNTAVSDNTSGIAQLNTRIDNLATLTNGSTTGDAELIDGRTGANGITYPSIGDAIRGQYTELNDQLIDYNAREIWDSSVKNGQDNTDAGVRYQWNNAGVCLITGLSSGYSWDTLKRDDNAFPDGFVAGGTVWAYYYGRVSLLQFLTKISGSWTVIAELKRPGTVNIPAAGVGLWIRIAVKQGLTANESVYPHVYSAIPNKYAQLALDDKTLTDMQMNLSDATDVSISTMWEQGAIDATSGNNVTSNQRYRIRTFLPTNVERVNTNNSDYGVYVYAYYTTGDFVGIYNSDGTFDSNGTLLQAVDVGDILRLHPTYRLRLSLIAIGAAPYPSASDAAAVSMTNSLTDDGEPKHIRVIQYNIGKFNFGGTAGIETGAAQKLENYKNWFAEMGADMVMMQEYVDYIDRDQTIDTAAQLFDPVYWYKSYEYKETIIYSNYLMQKDDFSYLQVSGDPPAWCIYADVHIKGRLFRIVSAVLNVTSTEYQKLQCLDKLINQICAGYDNVIICMDTNVGDYDEAVNIRDYMASESFKSANWTYFGFIPTYRIQPGVYRYIDNVFVKGEARVVQVLTGEADYNDLASDHYPVIADIVVR